MDDTDRVWVFFLTRDLRLVYHLKLERKKSFNTIFTVDNLRYPKNGPRFYVFFLNFFPCMKKKIPKTRVKKMFSYVLFIRQKTKIF